MTKGVVCVVVYSLVVIALFCVFCYLISTVDPPPLNIDHRNDSRRFMDLDSRNIFFDDEFVTLGTAEYGLEKVKNATDFQMKIELHNEHIVEDTYEKFVHIPLITRNTLAITWRSDLLFNATNSAVVARTKVKPKVSTDIVKLFSMTPYKRSISDGNANELRSIELKALDENEKSKKRELTNESLTLLPGKVL